MEVRVEGKSKLYEYGDRAEIDEYINYETNQLAEELNKILAPRVCEKCGEIFVTTRRASAKYCEKIIDNLGSTCTRSKVGRNKLKTPVYKIFIKTYRKIYAKFRFGEIDRETFTAWSINARYLRDQAVKAEVSIEELAKWLAESERYIV